MADDIKSWLADGCNYQVGLSLLERYGSNSFLLSLLKKSESDFNRQKLATELQALLASAPAEVAPERPAAAPRPSTPEPVANPAPVALDQPINYKAEPDLLQVVKQRDQSFGEMRMIKALTVSTPEGDALRDIAVRLVKLAKTNALAWERYNYLSEHPELEDDEPAAPPVMMDIRLLDKREQLRKSLNKAENRVKKLTKDGKKPNKNTLALIAQRKLELAELDKHIAEKKREATV